jgi:hypothetical protein
MLALSRLPLLRLARTPRAWLAIGAWLSLSLGFALVLRVRGHEGATDRFLLELYAPIAMPLLAMAITSGASGPEGVRTFVRGVMPFGARGTSAAFATIGFCAVACAIACALAAALGVALDHGSGADLVISLWVGALGGATYAAFFSFGSTFGPKGSGRGIFLVMNWFAANSGTAGSFLSPYAQIRSLFGGARAGDLSQRASSGALIGLFVACTLLTAWRCRRRA